MRFSGLNDSCVRITVAEYRRREPYGRLQYARARGFTIDDCTIDDVVEAFARGFAAVSGGKVTVEEIRDWLRSRMKGWHPRGDRLTPSGRRSVDPREVSAPMGTPSHRKRSAAETADEEDNA